MLLEGKKALITGSRRGIGRGIALAFAEQGADVGINDIELDQAAEDTMAMVREQGREASWHLADISDSSDINRMFDEFVEHHGRIDVLVNNAVASRKKHTLEILEEDWDFEVGNALKGYFLCSQRAAKEMVKQGEGGKIVSISSVHAFRAWPNDLVYGVCKAGVIRMAQSLAVDLADYGITANCVAPGFIDSQLLAPEDEHLRGTGESYEKALHAIPSRRAGVPRDIAGAVVFLCSELGDYVNGDCITVDGAFLAGGTPPG
jgi:NAD(P)-dependent dehydrogenase (short-subunit alcohol dehydrogenase family)